MRSLQILLSNVTIVLHWTWLGQNIVTNKPTTVRVLCTEILDIDPFLKIFAAGHMPWSVHYNASTLPPAVSWDIVLVLSHDKRDTKIAIETAAENAYAHRAQYLVVHLKRIGESDVDALGSIAWSLRLWRVLFLSVEDKAIFGVVPQCRLPKIIKLPILKWPDLSKMNLANCPLKVSVYNMTPHHTIEGKENTFKGIFVPFFRFIQEGLNFKALLIPDNGPKNYDMLMKGQVDMAFSGAPVKPDSPTEVLYVYFTKLTWCVPDTCELRDTSALLWQEFSMLTWTAIVTSLLVVSIAVKVTAPTPNLNLIDTIITIVATAAAIPVRMPGGLARLPLFGWLLATIVLSCCYQTILHSMMTAPLAIPELQDLAGLSRSKMYLACSGGATCKALLAQEKRTEEDVDIASRVIQVKDLRGLPDFVSTHKPVSVFTQAIICENSLAEMRPMPDYSFQQSLFSLLRVPSGSWLLPAVRRISMQADSSGLANVWYKREKPASCETLGGETIKPLSIHVLRPALLLLGFGFMLALIVFFAEVLWVRCKAQPENRESTTLFVKHDERSD